MNTDRSELILDGAVGDATILIEDAGIGVEDLCGIFIENITNSEGDNSASIGARFNAIAVLKIHCGDVVNQVVELINIQLADILERIDIVSDGTGSVIAELPAEHQAALQLRTYHSVLKAAEFAATKLQQAALVVKLLDVRSLGTECKLAESGCIPDIGSAKIEALGLQLGTQ